MKDFDFDETLIDGKNIPEDSLMLVLAAQVDFSDFLRT